MTFGTNTACKENSNDTSGIAKGDMPLAETTPKPTSPTLVDVGDMRPTSSSMGHLTNPNVRVHSNENTMSQRVEEEIKTRQDSSSSSSQVVMNPLAGKSTVTTTSPSAHLTPDRSQNHSQSSSNRGEPNSNGRIPLDDTPVQGSPIEGDEGDEGVQRPQHQVTRHVTNTLDNTNSKNKPTEKKSQHDTSLFSIKNTSLGTVRMGNGSSNSKDRIIKGNASTKLRNDTAPGRATDVASIETPPIAMDFPPTRSIPEGSEKSKGVVNAILDGNENTDSSSKEAHLISTREESILREHSEPNISIPSDATKHKENTMVAALAPSQRVRTEMTNSRRKHPESSSTVELDDSEQALHKRRKRTAASIRRLYRQWEERKVREWTEDATAPVCSNTQNVVGYCTSIDRVPPELLESSQAFLAFVPLNES